PENQESEERLAPSMLGEQARRIRADAEVRRVAERDDAGVAEDQVERQREQRGDGDLARQLQIRRRGDEGQQRAQPEDGLEPPPADLRFEMPASAFQTGPPGATSGCRPSPG